MTFRHPSVQHGTINHESGTYPIVDSVVECPEALGRALGLVPHVEPPPADDADAPPAPPKKGKK